MNVHIGTKIKAKAKQLRIGPTELGSLIGTSKQNVYSIYARKSIDCELLSRLSIALNHDFFIHYSVNHANVFEDAEPPVYPSKRNKESKTEKKLRLEIEECRAECVLLDKMYRTEVAKNEKLKGK